MIRPFFLRSLVGSIGIGLLIGCSGAAKVAPVSERIAKIWSARSVDENQTTVYSQAATNNSRPGYANFRLDLSNITTVRYTEYDGSTFVGQWTIPSDTRLVLSNLSPQPTGTNGTIDFTIGSLLAGELVITRTGNSQKTGNTTNRYTLTAP